MSRPKHFLVLPFLFLCVSSISFANEIAFIGDSHSAVSYGLFSHLAVSAKADGHNLTDGQAICGATINSYIDGSVTGPCRYNGVTHLNLINGSYDFRPGSGVSKKISVLMRKADTVIIQLGGNHVNEIEKVGDLAQRLARIILREGKRCIWIGVAAVPNSKKCAASRKKRHELNLAIANALQGESCDFIDSFERTKDDPPSSPDCRHYSDYSKWEGAIREDLLRLL